MIITYLPHCWQYLLFSPSRTTSLALAHPRQTLCLLWYPFSSLISVPHWGTWHLAVAGPALAVRGRFFPGPAASSSSSCSFASSSGHAQGIRPARKLEHVSLGSRFRILSELSGGGRWDGEKVGGESRGMGSCWSSRAKSRISDQSQREGEGEELGSIWGRWWSGGGLCMAVEDWKP